MSKFFSRKKSPGESAPEYAANRELIPGIANTNEFAVQVKAAYDAKLAELKADIGAEVFDKYCAYTFACLFQDDTGVVDSVEGRTSTIMMSLSTTIHRLAEQEIARQKFLPKIQQKNDHQLLAVVVQRVMQLTLAMEQDNGEVAPPPIVIPD